LILINGEEKVAVAVMKVWPIDPQRVHSARLGDQEGYVFSSVVIYKAKYFNEKF
jgi:hypothetical protein